MSEMALKVKITKFTLKKTVLLERGLKLNGFN